MKCVLCLTLCCTATLLAQSIPEYAPLSEKEWELSEEFIKKKAPAYFARREWYIAPQASHPLPIEKDPVTGHVFIHLKDHKGGYIGKGANKIVSKSILYRPHAIVVARSEANHSGKAEAEVLQKFSREKGLDHLYAMIPRGQNRYDLFVEYANHGSLFKVTKGKLHVSDTDLLSILIDLNQGLYNLHNKGYVHRDLKAANIFLTKNGSTLHAMIGDMGLTVPVTDYTDPRFCIPNVGAPPEIYRTTELTINRFQAEVYSLGMLFYMLVFEKKPVWTPLIQKRLAATLPEPEKQRYFDKIASLYTKQQSPDLQSVHASRRAIGKIVYKMMHPDPNQRPSLITVAKELERIS